MINYLKRYFLLILISTVVFSAEAQDAAADKARSEASFLHQKKSHLLNLGAGLFTNPNQFSFEVLTGGSATGDPSPAINISYEYGLTDQISVGALLGYYRVDAQQDFRLSEILNNGILDDPLCLAQCLLPISFSNSCDCGRKTAAERVNVLTMAGKFSYHYTVIPKLDTYTNLTLGYSFNRRKKIVEEALALVAEQVSPNTKIPTFVYHISAGLRYFVTPHIAAFGEFGYSNVHLLHVGASYRW